MNIVVGSIGILISFIGLLLPPIQALLPRISLVTYFRQKTVRRGLIAVGFLISLTAFFFPIVPFTWISIILTVIFFLMEEFLLVPVKVIPPLDRAVAVTGRESNFPSDASVLGVVVKGQARAYPLSLLIPHHIVNDDLGGVPITPAYCPACRSGYVFDPVVRGERLTFEPVSVHRRNMIMKDRQTGSIWQHETGECLMGELKGEHLKLYESEMWNWGAWLKKHPATTISQPPAGYRHPSPLGPIFERLLDHGPKHIIGPGLHGLDRRLGQHDFIAGIMIRNFAKAYPLAVLMEKGSIKDTLAGVPVELTYNRQSDLVQAWKGEGNHKQAIPVIRQWWLAWSEFHPGSEVFE